MESTSSYLVDLGVSTVETVCTDSMWGPLGLLCLLGLYPGEVFVRGSEVLATLPALPVSKDARSLTTALTTLPGV